MFGHPEKTWSCNTAPGPKSGKDINQQQDVINERPNKKARTEPKELFHGVFWPRDLLPEEIPKNRILTWGYDVQIEQMLSASSNASIFQHAETLLSDLASLRSSPMDKERPLIFIAHSLGGIVVKDALGQSRTESTFLKEILPATRGVIFLGTPHKGSKSASLGKIAFELSRVFFKDPNMQILRSLEVGSEVLERTSRSFEQVLADRKVQVHSFWEELHTKGVSIVDAFSATIGYLHESRSSLYANHRNMAKFSSSKDINFQRVASILGRWVKNVGHLELESSSSRREGSNVLGLPEGVIFDAHYKLCLKSLNVVEARIRVKNIEPAYKDTFDWLFGDDVGFRAWLEGKNMNPIYWISGKPGSGKSTLMKFAMTSTITAKMLEKYSDIPWILAGYFFHDRGSKAQKSTEGFLREILYQVLLQRRELFALVYPTFLDNVDPEVLKSATDNKNSSSFDLSWTINVLREAFMILGNRSTWDINLCIFVDALDEHDGDHRNMISLLRDLAGLHENPLLRVRLCLAGRSENVFNHAFHTYPGFVIQDYTTADIRHYAEDKIREEYLGTLDDESEHKAKLLVEEVVTKANGVFLWVNLALSELVEGLCNGDTLEELRELLSNIPQELADSYARAIRRVPRSSATALVKHRYEAYVIFQIAVCAHGSLDRDIFESATMLQIFGERSNSEMLSFQRGHWERRLNSKSAGLLEVKDNHVQLIHQTVKELLISPRGQELIREGVGDIVLVSGNMYILRYITHVLSQETEFEHNWEFGTENFLIYAQDVDKGQDGPVRKFIEPVIESPIGYQGILCALDSPQQLSLESVRYDLRVPSLYALCGLHSSLEQYLDSHKNLINGTACGDILDLEKHYGVDRDEFCPSALLNIIRAVLHVTGNDTPQTLLSRMQKSLDSYQLHKSTRFPECGCDPYWTKERFLDLRARLKSCHGTWPIDMTTGEGP